MKGFRNGMRVIFILLLFCCPEMLASAKGTVPEQYRVLFVSSYSMSFDTVPLQVKGIQDVLGPQDVSLDMEFMDTKRFSEEEDLELFYRSLRNKLEKLPPYDAVILGDDAALVFAMEYQQELFADIPLVFLGINSLELARRAGENPMITGIIEETSYRDNIDLALRLRPGADKLVALVDGTLTGQGDREQFLAMEPFYPGLSFSCIDSSDCTFEELGKKLEAIGDDTILFFLTMFQDKNKENLTIVEGCKFLELHAKVPVFRLSIGGVGDGLLGGIMVSYEESGKIAADMALRILHGTDAAQIPVVTKSPNFGYFDENILRRYGIDSRLLPQGSTLINSEPSFYVQYKPLIIGFLTICAVFLLGLILLAGDNYRRNKLLHRDFLTNLNNRMCMTQLLSKALEKGAPFSVLMLDIDDFKMINDTLGHMAGDKVLLVISQKLTSIPNKLLTVSRFGGDEFLCMIQSGEESDAREAAVQIQEALGEPVLIGDKKLTIRVSMGISIAGKHSSDVNELIAYADMAMYAVKAAGKGSYAFFHEKMLDAVKRKEYVERLLREAMEEKKFCLWYQPQIDAATGKLAGAEALLRIRNSRLSPAEFIPVAEECGLMVRIGREAARMAVEQMAAWDREGYPKIRVAVNFSNAQLKDEGYADYVARLLEEHQVDVRRVEIEITESIYLDQTQKNAELIDRLCLMGAQLSLDDFGTGYSSINYLTRVPVKNMKLDKSLIDKYSTIEGIHIIESIIKLAHGLGLTVTAEGVEAERQAAIMKNIGCDYLQGYYYDRPLQPEALEKNYLEVQK